MAVSTKGLVIHMSKGSTIPLNLVPTAVTAAKPAVVTVASSTGVTAGDSVKIEGTGIKSIDNKVFIVGTVTATSFELIGSNNTGGAIAVSVGAKAIVYKRTEMCTLCLSSLDFSAEQGQTISVGTYCDPSASIATPPTTAGTVTLNGYVNKDDACYVELLEATEDSALRILDLELPQNQGNLVTSIILSSIAFTTPLEGAIGFTATGSLGTKIRHVF
jgi:hypothetical protein